MRCLVMVLLLVFVSGSSMADSPVPVIFDTDISSDIDDVLALALLHELADRGEVDLIAVTISKDDPYIAPFVDAVNTFYGRPDIPIGVVKNGRPPWRSSYVKPVAERKENGRYVYPHDLLHGNAAPDATMLLRRILSEQRGGSVVIISVGIATNLARLLHTEADGISPRNGVELVRDKVRLLSWMAGHYGDPVRKPEANARKDSVATQVVLEQWPTPIVASGWEVGNAITYPAHSIEHDFEYMANHPVAEAYRLYRDMPYDRPTWDLTSVLEAARPNHGYFGLSHPGVISMDEQNITRFTERTGGPHRYLTVSSEQAVWVRETFIQMVSSPPAQ